jgi:hypothetical protein
MMKGVQGHAREAGLPGILDDRDASGLLDGGQAGGPVIQDARQHDADDAGPEGARRRAEQDVDRRPVQVLAGTSVHPHRLLGQEQMMVRRRDVNPALEEPDGLSRGHRRKPARPGEQIGKVRAGHGGHVEDDEEGSGKILGQATNDLQERRHSSR